MIDLRFAIRQLMRSPGFTVVAVLTLALGIGANAAIVTIINTLIFKSIVAKNSEQLRALYQHEVVNARNYKFFSYPDFVDLQRDKSLFSDLAAYNPTSVGLRDGDLLRRQNAVFVTASFFSVLGVPPMLGRTFLPEEDALAAQS